MSTGGIQSRVPDEQPFLSSAILRRPVIISSRSVQKALRFFDAHLPTLLHSRRQRTAL